MENFFQTQLANGMEVTASRQPGPHSACIGLYFHAGVLYESKAKNGISHLLEHLFFRRLDDLSQRQLYYGMEAIGGTLRAKTYCNLVEFDLAVSPRYFRQAADIIFRVLHPFQWKQDEIDHEKAVVLKQIAYKSTPFGEYVDSLYFKGTKLSMPIMGTEETVKNLSVESIRSYKNKFFNSRNACCVLTGDYTDQDCQYVLSVLDQISILPSIGLKSAVQLPVSFCRRAQSSDVILDTDDDISDVSISFDIDSGRLPECTPELISSILGEGDGSRLSLILREDLALTDEIYSRIDAYPGIKKMTVEFSVDNSDLKNSLILAFQTIRDLKDKIKQEDLMQSITFFTDNQNQLLDSPRDLNFLFGWQKTTMKPKLFGIDPIIQKYRQVTIYDLLRAANEIFKPSNLFIAVTNNQTICKRSELKKTFVQLREMLAEGRIR